MTNFLTKNLFVFVFLTLTVIGIFLPSLASADSGRLPTDWKNNVENIDELQKPVSGNSIEMIQTLFWKNIVPIAKYIFIGVSLIFFGMYAYYLVLGTGEEEQMTDQRANLLFAGLGFTLIGIAGKIVEIFDPGRGTNATEILDVEGAQTTVQQIINFLELGLGAIAIAVIFYAAVQMITANGDEEKTSYGKNLLKYGFLGFVFVMLADPLVNTIFFPNSGGTGVGTQEATNFIIQGLGVLKFVLAFFGAIIFIAFIVAAFLLITAGSDDDQFEKAKRILIWTIVGMIIVFISYSIVLFFLPQ